MVNFYYRCLQKWINNGCDENIANQIIALNISFPKKFLYEIPKEIFHFTQLQKLICCSNKITEIPKEIRCLTQLQVFECECNQIKEIPKEISCLTQLRVFNCSINQIKEIPKEISYLTQLEIFNCGNNQIKKIPKEIGCLTQLQVFYCMSNKIKKIPKEISYLTQLQIFNCNSNKIKEIPKEISCLTQLQELCFSYNQIKNIPKEISHLTLLDAFFIECNQIKEIPIEIRDLKQLQEFSIRHNQIKEIPIEIINCRNLTEFDYEGNQIDYIQPQIKRRLNRKKDGQQIYSDEQSIQEGVYKSVNYITSIKPSIQNDQLKELIINNQHLDEHVKRLLIEYMDNKEVHSILNITFEELLLSVYDFIERNENKEELFKIMNVEMSEENCKCFTERISRLINVLNGYDEHIEQKSNNIILIKNDLDEDYNKDEFKSHIRKERIIMKYIDEM